MTVTEQNKGLTTVRMGAHVLYMCNDHTVQYSRRICMWPQLHSTVPHQSLYMSIWSWTTTCVVQMLTCTACTAQRDVHAVLAWIRSMEQAQVIIMQARCANWLHTCIQLELQVHMLQCNFVDALSRQWRLSLLHDSPQGDPQYPSCHNYMFRERINTLLVIHEPMSCNLVL